MQEKKLKFHNRHKVNIVMCERKLNIQVRCRNTLGQRNVPDLPKCTSDLSPDWIPRLPADHSGTEWWTQMDSRSAPTRQCIHGCGCVFDSVYWLLPSSSSPSSFSSSTRGACRFAWEPSLKKTLLITPALGARIVCCGDKTRPSQTQQRTSGLMT